ncbi:proteasome subunit beta [Candidatus Woesearchaeota archaeon]|nr:proteasome subunit beta [Candidatus Woesearchaeota archaeon]
MSDDKEVLKTGTTTAAIICKDGIVMCADMRVTSGYLIAYKRFEKIVKITNNIALTVAGTVSDVQLLVKLIRAELRLKSIRTKREPYVKEAVNLLANMVYQNIRKMSLIPGISHFIVGGKDSTGYYVYDLGADGSITKCDDFCSSGSGSVMAYGVLETLYKKDMSIDEGIKLGVKSINAAIQRDAASGDGVYIVTITKDGAQVALTKEVEYKLEI